MAAIPIAEPVYVRLTNRRAYICCSPAAQISLRDFFSFRVPGAEFSERFRMGEWDGRKCLYQRSGVPAGLFLEMRIELEKLFALDVTDERVYPEFRELYQAANSEKGLRPYQWEALQKMVDASNCGGLVLSATGSGKTLLAGNLFKALVGNGCFICDELALLEQSRREISKALGEEVGIVGRSEFTPKRITCATIQTLARHRTKPAFRKWFESLDVLIIDEIHLALNKRNLDVVQQIKPLAVFGLTATLELEKPHVRLPAAALAGPVIFRYPIAQGVKEGFLSRGRIVRVEFRDPLKGPGEGYWSVDAEGRKYFIPPWHPQAQYRYHVALNRARNDLVEAVVREGVARGRRTVVLVEQRAHLATLSRRLADVPHKVASGYVKTEERLEAMRRMDAGELPLILSSRVFSKGIDIRSVDLIVDATGMPGRNGAMQRYGRGTRQAEGKDALWYVDVADRGNGKFGAAAKSRLRALQELGAPIAEVTWAGNAAQVFTALACSAK